VATKHHLIISGTGRAGTTFLVQLLTELGLDTGFSNAYEKLKADRNAGMEWDLRKYPDAPYIVKSPALCEHLEEILQQREIKIDHAIIPIRDLFSAAESRRAVARNGSHKILTARPFLGIKKWRIRKPEEQENVLAQNFHSLIHTLARYDIPLTLLHFPKFVTAPEYLFEKIRFLLKEIAYRDFLRAFEVISRPELVHDFAASKKL
jgi:hypothetical protein